MLRYALHDQRHFQDTLLRPTLGSYNRRASPFFTSLSPIYPTYATYCDR